MTNLYLHPNCARRPDIVKSIEQRTHRIAMTKRNGKVVELVASSTPRLASGDELDPRPAA